MQILGAWWGPKPDYTCFLAPLATQLNTMAAEGFMATNHNQQYINVTLRLLTVTADNPAKDALEKLKANACGTCHQEGNSPLQEKKKKKEGEASLTRKILNSSLSCIRCQYQAG